MYCSRYNILFTKANLTYEPAHEKMYKLALPNRISRSTCNYSHALTHMSFTNGMCNVCVSWFSMFIHVRNRTGYRDIFAILLQTDSNPIYEWIKCYQPILILPEYLSEQCNKTAESLDGTLVLEPTQYLWYNAFTSCSYTVVAGTGQLVLLSIR